MVYLISNYFDKILMVLMILPLILFYVAVVIRDMIIDHIVNISTYDFKDIYNNKGDFQKELENNTTFKNVILYLKFKKGLKD